MSITECVPEPNPAAALRKRVFVGFAGTLTVGLSLAGWYVGGRILAAGNTQPVTLPVVKTAIAPPTLPAPVPQLAPQASNRANPLAGETYLQLAAMGPIATEVYLKELARKGIHPIIRPGPSENIYRILMGPYGDASTLDQALRSLEAAGEKPMLRVY